MAPKIIIEDSSMMTVNLDMKVVLDDFLSLPAVTWYQTPTGKKKKEYTRRIIGVVRDPKTGVIEHFVPTGLLPKIKKFLDTKGVKYEIEGAERERPKIVRPDIEGITFREDQMTAFKSFLQHKRGVIVYPTGTGKTVLAAGIMSSYQTNKKRCQTLFLAHTKDLVYQAAEEFTAFGFNVGVWQGDRRSFGDVVVATRRTAALLAQSNPEMFLDFDMVIVDETHHISDFQGEYAQILHACPNAYARYGFTATKPTTLLAQWSLLCSIGPVIYEMTIADANEKGILAKPTINLVMYKGIKEEVYADDYKKAYRLYIVHNDKRNASIADIACSEASEGRSVLIFVQELKHGQELERILKERKQDCLFVQGKSNTDTRLSTKNKLLKKECLIVICTVIWAEGISIKSLNNVIIGSGGLDPKTVLQKVGRGTRLDEGKDEVTIWDFMDNYKYLCTHSIARMELYAFSGWEINVVTCERSLKHKDKGVL